ncbi:MAG: undecaprenyl-phosphate glucose phosphotransferase [Bacteroidota bacterium]|nr:undecaprenyl-phosphate glucose phosphotransferase [Bacteroidota bacterium]MDP4232645.1 undecaprenyl-phosphate glucose phosphotransferase [Bacteroidota bacterium]MDP4243897.1 undecaprenyl-phosphate glucose phosphotransferase [Bacteroidota bacterium]MDP4288434.1 undecaprenyl-phosphate glucose phosphotransferase [Bacteroidota bacterium]
MRSRPPAVGRTLLFLADLFVLNATYHLALGLRFGTFMPLMGAPHNAAAWSVYRELEYFLIGLWMIIGVWQRLYTPRSVATKHAALTSLQDVRAIGRAGLLLGAGLLIVITARGGYIYYSRLFLGYFLVAAPVVLMAFRIILQSAGKTVQSQRAPRKNLLIIGAGNAGEQFYRTVTDDPQYGYHVVGFLDDNGIQSGVRSMILGRVLDIDRIAARETIDEVMIALPTATEETISHLIHECENRCIRVSLLRPEAGAVDRSFDTNTYDQIGAFSIVRTREAPLDIWTKRLAKRSFDILFSLAVILFVFPLVYLASGIAIKLTSRGPVLFKQARTGFGGKTFMCYKFRTMRSNGTADILQAKDDDPRRTSVGRFLRMTSLDELPQFWNVLRGDMSVVGPRPHMLKHTEDYRNIISQYMVRHFVKPGLTGWAQVNGWRGATETPEAMQHRIEHDLYYIENWSFLLDLAIVGRTIIHVIAGDKNAY